jgi:ubiquitin carboxyl-terminal hydrolase 10
MSHFPKLNRNKNRKNEELPLGKSFEAQSVIQMLLGLPPDTFKVIEGRQEDAEEFLTFLLSGLSDEILAALKLLEEPASSEGSEDGHGEAAHTTDEWKEVGPKNKSCITRRHQSTVAEPSTPISAMFQGQIRSCVSHTAAEPTATLQPFFTLQLDIQCADVHSVAEALVSNFSTEVLDGYVNPQTKEHVDASRSLTLEELPPILVLHLKRFVYDEKSGGSQKLLKPIDFRVDLEVPREILSATSKNKYGPKQRQYKLFSVVYHNGTEATKGHYVTDVYHAGLASWLRCDDSLVRAVSDSHVLAPITNSLPYILFYRRCDTMVSGAERHK